MDEETMMSAAGVGGMADELTKLETLLRRRHSCRGFLQDPVPRETIRNILIAAQQTASWCNAQPWQVHVVGGRTLELLRSELFARASKAMRPEPDVAWPDEYRGIYQARRREAGWALYSATGVRKGDRAASLQQSLENFRLFGAPHLAILSCDRALGTYGLIDCGAWISNFLLAATAAGVGTIAQGALSSWPGLLRQYLDIPQHDSIVCGISFGFEDAANPANGFRVSRAPIDEVVTWVD